MSNTNEILKNNPLDSEIYNKELFEMINESESLVRFWFDSYLKESDKEYIVLDIQSESICAKGRFLVIDWTGIEQIQKVKERVIKAQN